MAASSESDSISKQGCGISISIDNIRGDVEIHHAGHNAETCKEPSPEKPKSISLWDLILGAAGGLLVSFIASILLDYYAEPVKNNPIPLVVIFLAVLFITIFIRHRLASSKT